MKYLRQFCIILFVSFLGEMLHIVIPLPVPASVYGLVLMLLALCTGILKQEQVGAAADFLIEIILPQWDFWTPGPPFGRSGSLLS
jgi:holin-like protein